MIAAPASSDGWHAAAAAARPRGDAFIDGAFVSAADGRTFGDPSPRDGRHLADVARCGREDVDRAVRGARRAFASGAWSQAAPKERRAVPLRLGDLMEARGDELALLESLDVDKPIGDALGVDVPKTIATFRWYAEALDKLYGEIAPTGPDALALVEREPVGVVGAVVPWNYPLIISAWKLAPALAMGNSVVLKPAEQSPLSALGLAAEAGLPDGVLSVVPGFGPVLAVLEADDAEHAVALADDTPYGLAAAVWTRDLARARRIARRLRAGTVWINTFDAAELATPFGGVGASGHGRDRSLHALEHCTHLKTTWIAL